MSDLYTIDKLKKHFEVTVEELLPSQSGNSGKFLTTNGTSASWSSDPFSNWNKDYNDLINTPTTVSSFTNDAGYLTSVNWNDVGNKPTFATVATTGDYTDLINTPTIPVVPTNVSAFTNDSGYITGVTWDDITNKPATFTPAEHDHDGVYATPSDVSTAVANLVNSAPTTLDTLDELANALGDDPNFATTVATQIGEKLDADSSDYVKSLSISGTTITVTKGDNTTSTLTTQDTTYTLPEATISTLGGVIVGDGLSVTNGTISVDNQLPTQTNNSGKFLTTNGTTASWSTVDALPSQTGNSGKYLTTNGSTASWVAIESYSLPTAAADTLGGVKIGNGITITNGVISADDQLPSQANNSGKFLTTNGTSASWVTIESYVLPTATSDTLGGIKVGTNLSIDSNGVLSATDTTYSAATTETAGLMSAADKTKLDNIDTGANNYSLPIAGSSTLGGVKVGSNLSINSSTGVLSADNQLPAQTNNSGKFLSTNGTTASWTSISEYSLPIASSSALGGIKVGTNLSINDTTGVLSATDTVTTATTSGDGNAVTSITASNGALTVTKGSTFSLSTHNHDNVYAPLASPAFTGTPTAPTATAGTNSTQVATTAYVDSAVSSLVNSAPTTLDTLNELAAALGNDPNFATTVSTSIGEKLDADSANYVKSLSISGTTVTVTKGNDTTSTLTTQDTTYTQGTGITISNGVISANSQLPSQTNNAGKFLTTDGTDASWSDILNETKISSVHYPTANATTVVLTQAQAIPSTTNKYAMSVYRNGIYLNSGIDYGYNNSTRTLTFTDAFEDDEIVTVVFSYIDTDSQVTLDIDVDEYEAGTGITFTNNSVTNKVVINADDQLPSQANNSGKFLTTNGTTASWTTVEALPSQTGNSGKFLTTDGTDASWGSPFSLVREFNTTAGQNTLTLPSDFLTLNQYDAMVVFLDGIRLVKNVDYTFDSSTRVLTFVDTFISGDTVTVGLYANNYESLSSGEFPALASGILTSDGNSMSWKSFTKMVYTQDTTSANETVTIPQENLTNAVVTDVFRNGLLLVETDDYTINSSTREITFVVPIAANEKIVVVTQNAVLNSSTLISGASIQNSTATTPATNDNSTSIATTAYVNNKFANPIEKVNTITSAASITIDPNAGSLFTLSLSTNASITIGNISNGPYTTNGSTITLYLSNTSNTITWNSKITWMSGEAPDVTSNPSIITFVTFNGGTNWYGSSIEVKSSS